VSHDIYHSTVVMCVTLDAMWGAQITASTILDTFEDQPVLHRNCFLNARTVAFLLAYTRVFATERRSRLTVSAETAVSFDYGPTPPLWQSEQFMAVRSPNSIGCLNAIAVLTTAEGRTPSS
jgi:hypothetical protein